MHRLGRTELVLDDVPTLDELVAHVDAISMDDVDRVIQRVIAQEPRVLAVVGPFDADDFA
jgi:predicted Zn-dependent peptidase